MSLPVTYQNAQARFKDLYTTWYIGTCTAACNHPMAVGGDPYDWLYRPILVAWPSTQEFPVWLHAAARGCSPNG